MRAAGWQPADPVTLRSRLEIAGSVLARRAYPTAPVSDLFYDGRRQDLAFEKPAGISPKERHHVRFWLALDQGDAGLPVWLGSATFDRSVGVSHYTGQVTHHIAPDIDAERDLLAQRPRRLRPRRGDLLGHRRRPDPLRPQRRRRPLFHRRRNHHFAPVDLAARPSPARRRRWRIRRP